MKEKLIELEKKEMESKESERLQMNILIKREKELEELRMSQWKEKQHMMETLRNSEKLAEEKLQQFIMEAETQRIETEKRKEVRSCFFFIFWCTLFFTGF